MVQTSQNMNDEWADLTVRKNGTYNWNSRQEMFSGDLFRSLQINKKKNYVTQSVSAKIKTLMENCMSRRALGRINM